MGIVTVEEGLLSDTAIRVSWTTPNSRGSDITGYQFWFLDHEDVYQPGSLLGISVQVQDTWFELDMNLLVEDPFFLEQGDLIVITVQAVNDIGASEVSDPNAVGVEMQQAPTTPPSAPIMVSQAETSITVQMPEVTGLDTGGSPITSYNLVYSPNLSYASIIGENPNNLLLTITKGGLNTNTVYKFKYRVSNKFGWSSDYSPYVEIRTATFPSLITTVTFQVVD